MQVELISKGLFFFVGKVYSFGSINIYKMKVLGGGESFTIAIIFGLCQKCC